MSPSEETTRILAEKLRALHVGRATAELAAADRLAPGSDRVMPRGAVLADIAAVKGLPGPAEASGGAAISGADGEALLKALEALGWTAEQVFYTLSRPEPAMDRERASDRLRLQIEAVDPVVIVALDAEAADDLAEAFGCERPAPGTPVRVLGRRLVAVSGFEASLSDAGAKQRVWAELKHATPERPVY